jgi:putative transposase
MKLTLTAKVKLIPTQEQQDLLLKTVHTIKLALNYTSRFSHQHEVFASLALHNQLYSTLRTTFGLRSQMTQSVFKTVAAKYKSMKSNQVDGKLAIFKKPEYDLVYNRDYSVKNGSFSLNTLDGRVKVPFEPKGMVHFFDGIWKYGTAKLVIRQGKFFLHLPMTKEVDEWDKNRIPNIMGIDLGINFLATTYDSNSKTLFYKGREVKNKRAHYAQVRKSLQQKQTSSARRRLKMIGNRENRWMRDINHGLSKALVTQAGPNSLLVLEDLSGVRKATEKVYIKDRYVTVSWAFSQLRKMIEYKAALHKSKVIAVNPAHTSQTCPKCAYIDKANRIKKVHTFCCKLCRYTSNDDRIGAMNLQHKGVEYLLK